MCSKHIPITNGTGYKIYLNVHMDKQRDGAQTCYKICCVMFIALHKWSTDR